MARSNKNEPKNSAEATTVVNVADFQRTRDSVIVALATLQSSVQDLSRAYINHANTVLNPGRGPQGLDFGLTGTLLENGLLPGPRPTDPETKSETGGEAKKKRKRAPHDPNAPKRALTPYFLYMQTARPIIAKELGENAKPKEVADEGTRRWAAMKEPDKRTWTTQYAHNLAIYREKMKAYKAGLPVPDDDEAAKQLQSGPAAAAALEDIEAEIDEEEEEEEEEEPVKEPTPPPKATKKRKTDKGTPAAAAATPAKEAASTPAKKASPEKKKKTKKEEAAEKAKKPAETPKAAEADKKKKSKKRKSDAVATEE